MHVHRCQNTRGSPSCRCILHHPAVGIIISCSRRRRHGQLPAPRSRTIATCTGSGSIDIFRPLGLAHNRDLFNTSSIVFYSLFTLFLPAVHIGLVNFRFPVNCICP